MLSQMRGHFEWVLFSALWINLFHSHFVGELLSLQVQSYGLNMLDSLQECPHDQIGVDILVEMGFDLDDATQYFFENRVAAVSVTVRIGRVYFPFTDCRSFRDLRFGRRLSEELVLPWELRLGKELARWQEHPAIAFLTQHVGCGTTLRFAGYEASFGSPPPPIIRRR